MGGNAGYWQLGEDREPTGHVPGRERQLPKFSNRIGHMEKDRSQTTKKERTDVQRLLYLNIVTQEMKEIMRGGLPSRSKTAA